MGRICHVGWKQLAKYYPYWTYLPHWLKKNWQGIPLMVRIYHIVCHIFSKGLLLGALFVTLDVNNFPWGPPLVAVSNILSDKNARGCPLGFIAATLTVTYFERCSTFVIFLTHTFFKEFPMMRFSFQMF